MSAFNWRQQALLWSLVLIGPVLAVRLLERIGWLVSEDALHTSKPIVFQAIEIRSVELYELPKDARRGP